MTVGTTLSRLTGYVRIAAQTAALGVTVGTLGNVYVQANTTPNIVYELILGGILTSVFVPVFVDHQRRGGREAAFDLGRRVLTLALVLLSGAALLGIVFAPQIMRLYLVASDAPDVEAQVELGRLPVAMVHAADRLLRHRRDRRRAPQRRAPVRRADVRPDPQQPRGDRDVRRVRDAARGDALRRPHHRASRSSCSGRARRSAWWR